MSAGHCRLCRPSEIPEATGRGFSLAGGPSGAIELLAVRAGDRCLVYLNHCPHRGLNLDWVPGQFLDPDGAYIQCANHDALFRIDDGLCVAGPCAGGRLTPVPATIDADGFLCVVLPG